MKVAVSSSGSGLDAQVSPIFGRCAYFVLVDSETMEATAVANSAVGAAGGAGIQSAQYVLRQGAEAVISGNVGPNAMQVLASAGLPLYQVNGVMSVRQAVEALNAGQLPAVGSPTVGSDYGKGAAGPGTGRGGGLGRGRGMGRGGGRGRGA
jgi:predicted Fe-Mo cluster-binding NifX family protein